MEYKQTRHIPDRIPMNEKTGLPNYINERVGHHTSNSGTHFHGNIAPRTQTFGTSQGIHGGYHGTDTKVRDIPTYQSSIFTKHKYERMNPGKDRTYDVPLEQSGRAGDLYIATETGDHRGHGHSHGYGHQHRAPAPAPAPVHTIRETHQDGYGRTIKSSHGQPRTFEAAEARYQEQDRQVKELIKQTGRADHVEKVIKASIPEQRLIDEDTTYKRKFAVEGFERHHPQFRERDPVGKISSVHWNAYDY